MQLLERAEGNALVVKVLAMRLDASTAPEVKSRIVRLIKMGHRRLVIDLSEVDFIDSKGLGVVVFALKRLESYGKVAVSGPRGAVVSMLKLTQLHRVLNIFPSCEQAIEALGA